METLTKKEIDFIRKNSGKITPKEIAQELGKQVTTVRLFINDDKIHDVKIQRKQMELTVDQKKFIKANAKTMSVNKIAIDINSNWNTVYRYMKNHNIDGQKAAAVAPVVQEEPQRSFSRPPAFYSNPDWSQQYLD